MEKLLSARMPFPFLLSLVLRNYSGFFSYAASGGGVREEWRGHPAPRQGALQGP